MLGSQSQRRLSVKKKGQSFECTSDGVHSQTNTQASWINMLFEANLRQCNNTHLANTHSGLSASVHVRSGFYRIVFTQDQRPD